MVLQQPLSAEDMKEIIDIFPLVRTD